jgi:hypothetical protein
MHFTLKWKIWGSSVRGILICFDDLTFLKAVVMQFRYLPAIALLLFFENADIAFIV